MKSRTKLVALGLFLLAARPLPAATFAVRTTTSPADGAPIRYGELLPAGYSDQRTWPLVVFLHGGHGDLFGAPSSPDVRAAVDSHGTVFISYDGRAIPGQEGRSWYYVDCGNAPDETDVLAILDDTLRRLPIDRDRVYLAGCSQGGKGTWGIGLRNPDRFAALAAMMPVTDAFWSEAIGHGGYDSDWEDAAGGPFGTSPQVNARWFAQSPRFYTENARNLPMFIAHGDADTVAPNTDPYGIYHNSHHVTDDPTFSDDKGHTPTLGELHAADPQGYEFHTKWVPGVGHECERVASPAEYLAFFQGRRRAASPRRVVYTAYDVVARPRRAYFVALGREGNPTSDDGLPTRVLADADPAANSLSLELTPRARVTVDLAGAGLSAVSDGATPSGFPPAPSGRTLLLRVSRRGAAGATGEEATVVLSGSFASGVNVTRGGQPVPVERTASALTLRGLPLDGGAYVIAAAASLGLLSPNGGDSYAEGARVTASWSPSPLATVTGYRLLYSTDGGATFPLALTPVLPASALAVDVVLPCGAVASARLRVEALAGGDPAGSDDSDASFQVTATGTCGAASTADLLIPGCASAAGANGARFTTEAVVANRSGSPLRVSVRFHGDAARAPSPAAVYDLAPSAEVSIQDVVGLLGEAGAAGAVAIRATSGDARALVAGGRTSSPAGGGTFGFFLPAVPASAALQAGETGALFGAAGPEARTNLGLFALDAVEASVAVLDGAGQRVGGTDVSLAAGEWRQLSNLGSGVTLLVRVRTGRLHAYVTAVSNSPSNDALGGLAAPLSRAAAELVVPAVASAPGANGAFYSSTLRLLNPSAAATANGRVAFTPRGASEPSAERGFTLAPGASLTLRDVVRALLGGEGTGSLRVTSDVPLLASSATATTGPLGLAAQDFAAFRRDEAIPAGASADAAGLAEDERFRTNLVLLNLGRAEGTAVISATAADGSPLGEVSRSIPAGASVQIDRVLRLFTGSAVSGARVTVRAEREPLLAVTSEIDNATNDPTSVPFVAR